VQPLAAATWAGVNRQRILACLNAIEQTQSAAKQDGLCSGDTG
jgi:hypothetical protein